MSLYLNLLSITPLNPQEQRCILGERSSGETCSFVRPKDDRVAGATLMLRMRRWPVLLLVAENEIVG